MVIGRVGRRRGGGRSNSIRSLYSCLYFFYIIIMLRVLPAARVLSTHESFGGFGFWSAIISLKLQSSALAPTRMTRTWPACGRKFSQSQPPPNQLRIPLPSPSPVQSRPSDDGRRLCPPRIPSESREQPIPANDQRISAKVLS